MLSIETNIILMAILLFLSGFFSGTETALVSLDRVAVRQLVKKGSKSAKIIEEFQANPQKMLSAILIGNNLVNIAATAVATALALQVFESNAIGIAVGIMAFLILVFGEITPKSIAVRNAQAIALIVARPVKWLSIALSPIIWFLTGMTKLVTRVIGSPEIESLTEQDIKTMVTLGAEAGAIHENEKLMINRIFKFNDVSAEDVMTPRSEMIAVEESLTLQDLSKMLAETPYSKLPVYKKKLENIVGVFYVKDAWEYLAAGKTDTVVNTIMRPAAFTPKTKKIDRLLAEFQQTHNNMAIVVDDYGGVIGVVTLEDLLEEIVGEIIDESELEAITQVDENTLEVDGKTPLGEINRILKTKWKGDEFHTVSGFMIEKLDRLPKQNEEIAIGNYCLKAVKVNQPKIQRIKIYKKANSGKGK
ncbi:MAG: HlyC/CorC family transporter [Candidatus Diapherotrites archaeon]|uniref:HlyC/CorC family transporter n=1 Tax=Candidatus Iainarchaeum sp. TaxID=3101447 RepID=A0A938YWJ4_9ARCH|nr:HlyC/CorC family transporter [Candidatus Diapherotrites archaeon]